MSALEIQRAYCDAARAFALGRDEETDWVLREWQRAIDALGRDPLELRGMCDWVTKKWLLDSFAESEGLDWQRADDRAWLQSQDLEYHNVDPDEGLYLMLEQQGHVTQLMSDEEVRRAMVAFSIGYARLFPRRGVGKILFARPFVELGQRRV